MNGQTAVPPITTHGLWRDTRENDLKEATFNGDLRAEVAIVGAGFCGLSAALHLAEAGVDALVLEGAAPGWGASGRNGGQVIAGLKTDYPEMLSHFGPQKAEAMHRLGAETADLTFSLIERFQIRCEAHRDGWIQAAHSKAMLKSIRARADDLSGRGENVEWLSAERIQALTGAPYYRGGMLDRRSGMVQPLSYAQGLAGAATALGARIYHDAQVLTLTPEEGGWRLETARGSVRARQVLLATNAYLGHLHPALITAMIPVKSYQIATDPLPPELDKAVLPSRLPTSDLMDLGVYFRRDDSGRFIIGGSGSLTEQEDPALFDVIAQSAAVLYPALTPDKFTSRWGGKLALTRDHLPRLTSLSPGLYAAYGCNGRGVALMTMMGKLAAERLRGIAHPDLPITNDPPARYPFYGFRLPVMALVRRFRRLRRTFARG